jgi:hypothetical protein
MPGVIADPAFFLDQVGDTRRCPQPALVSQGFWPSLQAAFDASQVFRTQPRFASRPARPLERSQSAFLELLRPAPNGLPVGTNAAGYFRLVYTLAQ